MYSINGIALHDATRGWRVMRDGTDIQGGISNSLNKVQATGRGGYRPTPHTFAEQIVVFNMRVTRAGLEPLLALVDGAQTLTRTADSTKEMLVELASAKPTSDSPWDSEFDVTVTLSGYDGYWRDVTQVIEGPITIGSSSTTHQILSGLSAPIEKNVDIFLRGSFDQFTLQDSGGSVLKTVQSWPGSSTTGLLYMGATQQAFLSNDSDKWTPLSDRSQYIDVSGNGGFQITPFLVSGDPSDRVAKLVLTVLATTDVELSVRARRSYRMN